MKIIPMFKMEAQDPSLGFVDECLARLMAFIKFEELEKPGQRGFDEPFIKARNRVIDNNEFTEDDIRRLADYLVELAGRAETRYNRTDIADAPWVVAVLQSAKAAREASQRLMEVFYKLAPNMKPVAPEPEAVAATTTTVSHPATSAATPAP